jgi:hypothetical protein
LPIAAPAAPPRAPPIAASRVELSAFASTADSKIARTRYLIFMRFNVLRWVKRYTYHHYLILDI